MNLDAEIEYQKSVPEVAEQVRPTSPERILEYREARHWKTDPLHCFLAAIHRLKPTAIYEFGCGAGELTTRLAKCGYEVTGIELSPDVLAVARKRATADEVEDRVHFVEGDAIAHREDSKFGLVIAKLVLHHLDLNAALDAICAHMEEDGTAVFYEPVAFSKGLQWLRDHSFVAKDVSPNERQLSAQEIRQICSRFRESKVRYFYLTSRLCRLMPGGRMRHICKAVLEQVDRVLLPVLSHFAGAVVIEAKGLRR